MKQAVILTAGEGQRLRPFTVTKPKAMLTVAARPILAYVVEALVQNGIRNLVLVVGYKKEQIFDYLESGEQFGVDISYVTQERQLGTGHALAQARSVVDREFLVLPGNKLIDADTIARFVDAEPQAVLVKRVDNPYRYGVVMIESGTVKTIIEKPREAVSSLTSTGIYAFNRDIFEYVSAELNIPDALNAMIAGGRPLQAFETEGTWLDVVYPWDIISLNNAVIHKTPQATSGTIEHGVAISGLVSIGKDTVVKSNSYLVGPLIVGDGCQIGPNVCILPATSIGRNVVIAPFTEIENSVIGDDVTIGPGSIIQDSVIDRGCVIGGHFTACSDDAEFHINGERHIVKVGAILGEGCNLGNSVTAQPGVVVGNYARVKSMKLVSEVIPDKSLVV